MHCRVDGKLGWIPGFSHSDQIPRPICHRVSAYRLIQGGGWVEEATSDLGGIGSIKSWETRDWLV